MKRTHGQSQTPLYRAWINMRTRCYDPNTPYFKNYGGRGIKVDPAWDTFEQFAEDMGPRPERTSLDRINNDGDYGPDNCRWSTYREQKLNTRRTTRILVFGESMSITEAAEKFNINETTLTARLRRGMDPSEAVLKPRQRR